MGNSDPVLSLLKDFSYLVVRLPRTGIKPLQVLEKQGNDVVVLGDLSDLFKTGSAALPSIGTDEQAAFINGRRTRDLKISVGLTLLGGIIGAMTGTKLSLDVGYKKASALAFEFDDVKVSQINQIQLSKFLTAAKIDESVGPPAKLLDADELYVITNTIKSKKFTVDALREGGASAEVNVPIIKAAVGGSVAVKTEGGSASKVSYQGDTSLVFGFQAARMEFENGVFKGLKQVSPGSVGLRGISGRRAEEGQDTDFEMLQTDGPFVNLFDHLPESKTKASRKTVNLKASQGRAKTSTKKVNAKGGTKKSPSKKGRAQKSASHKSAKKSPRKR